MFDDAEDTYGDDALWNCLNDVRDGSYDWLHAMLFTGYNSSTADSVASTADGRDTPPGVTPDFIMTLYPSRESPHALVFTQDEFNDYMSLISTLADHPALEPDLLDYIYNTSAGHIGAIKALLSMAMMKAVRLSSCV